MSCLKRFLFGLFFFWRHSNELLSWAVDAEMQTCIFPVLFVCFMGGFVCLWVLVWGFFWRVFVWFFSGASFSLESGVFLLCKGAVLLNTVLLVFSKIADGKGKPVPRRLFHDKCPQLACCYTRVLLPKSTSEVTPKLTAVCCTETLKRRFLFFNGCFSYASYITSQRFLGL